MGSRRRKPGELTVERHDVPGQRRVDRVVEGEGAGVADDRPHVVEGDAARAGGIEAELLHLGAGQAAVGAEQEMQRVARILVDRELVRRRFLRDQPSRSAPASA